MPDNLLNLKLDIVFQELFGNPKNYEITGHLLSLILKRKVYSVDLDVNKRLYGNSDKSKIGRLDLRVKFNDGEDCNVELQVSKYNYMPQRMLEYWAIMYQNKISRGQDYSVLKPSISILIAGYELDQTQGISNYHTKWNLREEKYHNKQLTNDIEMHVLEIPKVKNSNIENDELAQWLMFIDNPDSKEVEKFMCENKFLKQAKEELAYLSGEENFKFLVQDRAHFLMEQVSRQKEDFANGKAVGKTEGETIGKVKGQKEKQIEIAKKMKEKNMPIYEIVEFTGLTKEEIEKL